MPLETEIRAFDARRDELISHFKGKWVVFHAEDFIGAFNTLESAAAEAIRRFGRGPYLIRQVGEEPQPLPLSWEARGAVAKRADR